MQPPLLLRIVTHLILGLCCLVVLLPLLWVLRTSFADKVVAYQLPPALFFTPTLDNYRMILVEMNFGTFFLNSLIISLTSTLLAVVIGPCSLGGRRETAMASSSGRRRYAA